MIDEKKLKAQLEYLYGVFKDNYRKAQTNVNGYLHSPKYDETEFKKLFNERVYAVAQLRAFESTLEALEYCGLDL